MKIPDLFYPECKQSLRLIMRCQSERKTVTFLVLVTTVEKSFGSKKKNARMGSINSSVLNHKKKEN